MSFELYTLHCNLSEDAVVVTFFFPQVAVWYHVVYSGLCGSNNWSVTQPLLMSSQPQSLAGGGQMKPMCMNIEFASQRNGKNRECNLHPQ